MKRIAISIGHYPEKRGASFDGLIEHDLAHDWVDQILDTFDDIYDFDYNMPSYDLIPVPVGTLTPLRYILIRSMALQAV